MDGQAGGRVSGSERITAATVESIATLHFHMVPNAKQSKVVRQHRNEIKLRAPAVERKS
jgi:hypothetical protein